MGSPAMAELMQKIKPSNISRADFEDDLFNRADISGKGKLEKNECDWLY